jgi:chromosomal replication initiation ATPase DnaA
MSDALLNLLRERHPERWHQEPLPAPAATLPRVRDWLLLTSRTPSGHIQIKTIIAAVAEHYRISTSDIISSRRTANVVRPRQVAMYLAKTLTLRSLPAIGRLFDRDNTTVLHAVRKIEGLLKQDSQLAADIAGIQRRIGPPMQEAA